MNSTSSPTISNPVYVWIWLPGATEPIPCGVLTPNGNGLAFTYGRKYLANPNRISIYTPELPLSLETFAPTALEMPSAIRDAAPDAWGQHVILAELTGAMGRDADVTDLDPATYLLTSGSNRIGALDFQKSPTKYVPRVDPASLIDLETASQQVLAGKPPKAQLAGALLHGTSIGGARPKALFSENGVEKIAKFSVSSDHYPVVKAEAAAIYLARQTGIEVTDAELRTVGGRDVLVMDRFDRGGDGSRRLIISGLTMLGLSEMGSRHGTYLQLQQVLGQFSDGSYDVGRALFDRIAFNIIIANTDDHLRNHAAFWDGTYLHLTPAYDLSPTIRRGETATQVLAYGPHGQRKSNLAELVEASNAYSIPKPEAKDRVLNMLDTVEEHWSDAADFAQMAAQDRQMLWRTAFSHPAASWGLTNVV